MPRNSAKHGAEAITTRKLREWQKRYDNDRNRYESTSDHILRDLRQYRQTCPKTVRLVFSREPKLKSWSSILDKIREKRQKEDENYTYDDLPDIIALTVLCAYPSDVKEVIPWLRKAFDIKNSDADARRFNPRGHRAYHYIVSARSDVLLAHPELIGVKCEIQIKTLLDEALDAKTHDLTYRPGRRRVPIARRSESGKNVMTTIEIATNQHPTISCVTCANIGKHVQRQFVWYFLASQS